MPLSGAVTAEGTMRLLWDESATLPSYNRWIVQISTRRVRPATYVHCRWRISLFWLETASRRESSPCKGQKTPLHGLVCGGKKGSRTCLELYEQFLFAHSPPLVCGFFLALGHCSWVGNALITAPRSSPAPCKVSPSPLGTERRKNPQIRSTQVQSGT